MNEHSKGATKSGIDDEDEDFINDMADGQAKDAQIQNIVFNKTGKLIPRYTIRQITKYKKRTIINESDFEEMFHNQEKDDLSSTEYMMRNYVGQEIIAFNYYQMILSSHPNPLPKPIQWIKKIP